LLVTPLLGADGEVYAVAQGTVSSGGFVVKGQGASVTKGVPTAGRIPTGAIVEREVGFQLSQLHSVSLMLHNPDFTTARRVAQVINAHMKSNIAQPTDPSTVVLNVPADLKGDIVNLMTDIEQLQIEPDQVARVVIDEQNGIIVMGENVRISTVAVAQGNLTVKVTETPQVSQPNAFAPGGQPTTFNPLNASGVVPNPNPIFNPTQPPASGPFAQTPGNSTLQNQGTIQPYSAPQPNNPALPGPPGDNNVQFNPGGGASTVVVPRTNIQVDEQSDHRMAVVKSGVTLQELVNNLNALGVGPRDMISILQAIKAAGALQADIEMM
jgi:flagellar P-ring protein precursor FlgI